MKFWKILSNQIEQTLPDWRDKFLSYKDLKKQLKLIAPKDAENPPGKKPRLDPSGDGDGEVTKEVKDFLKLLEVEIDKFNGFFVEKEEEYIIKWKLDGLAGRKSKRTLPRPVISVGERNKILLERLEDRRQSKSAHLQFSP